MATVGPQQQEQGEEPKVVSVLVATLLCYSLLTHACLFADCGKSPERGSPPIKGSQGLIWSVGLGLSLLRRCRSFPVLNARLWLTRKVIGL
jgi:hypothetical protein